MSENEQQPSDLDLLSARLDTLKRQSPGNGGNGKGSASFGYWLWAGFNVVSDLIAGVACGLGIGYGLDRWLGTRPAFTAVFLIFGCAGGLLNAVRFLNDRQKQEESGSSGLKER